jgi:eukaryotic-like serine/threonine-protein kinase
MMAGSTGRAGRPLSSDDPEHIGDYRLLAVLGVGGMGRVYLAESPADRLVAVKMLRSDIADSERFRRRFRDEVARAAQVPPFCTAEVLDADPDHDPPYLVVEYVDGPDLASVVQDSGPLSPANLHALAIGVATALTAIHSAGVVHRDLKAANVLLAPGSPKVIDFGLAREVDASVHHTTTGELVGTVAYMAPERLEPAGRELTPAADIFAWGAVVTLAGTARVPFPADTLPGLAYRIMTEPPDLDGLPDGLRELVAQALAKDPADRPTARDLLDRLLATGPSGAADPATVPADRTELLRAARRRANVAAADAADRTTEAAGAGGTAATVRSPAPARRRWAGAALALVAVLAVGAVVAGQYGWLTVAAPSVPAGSPSPPPPSPVQSPESSPSGSPAPGMIPAGTQLTVRDDLTAAVHWEERTDEATGTTCAFADGLVATTGSESFRCPGPRDNLSDLAVSVDVDLVAPGSCATIWFRFTVTDGGYALRVCEEAYYFVTHGTPEPRDVRDLRRFLFDAPLDGRTRIGIAAEGDTFRFYRDGAEVGAWSDPTFTSGQVWLGILQMDPEIRPPYQVTFADVEIWGRGG